MCVQEPTVFRRGGTRYSRAAVKGVGELPHGYYKIKSGSL